MTEEEITELNVEYKRAAKRKGLIEIDYDYLVTSGVYSERQVSRMIEEEKLLLEEKKKAEEKLAEAAREAARPKKKPTGFSIGYPRNLPGLIWGNNAIDYCDGPINRLPFFRSVYTEDYLHDLKEIEKMSSSPLGIDIKVPEYTDMKYNKEWLIKADLYEPTEMDKYIDKIKTFFSKTCNYLATLKGWWFKKKLKKERNDRREKDKQVR